ncbi:uncharacterized protein LOC129966504 [Argiope bruennichi]|uniref:uncharacterized protein LOC129966504 n=1 Tax=Argiope bruennichi TaxID=94029 RepID=UPI002494F510|nr:uncharacterized protein LOC129966504 [Argiope bruennichi]
MSMSELSIDNEILIALVQERPVLWDKTLDIFKDKNATRNAWHEVCLEIYSDFDELEEKKRNELGKEVTKRWKHLRDAFAKAEKRANESRASGSKTTKKRKYIFSDELQFLKKLYDKTETTQSFLINDENKDETDGSCQQPFKHSQHEELITETKGKAICNTVPRKKFKKSDEVNLKALVKTEEVNLKALEKNDEVNLKALEKNDEVNLKALEKNDEVNLKALEKTAPEKLNAQMSFFHSLLSHTENFNSDEWLQFQIEVLQIISNIKNQKAAVPYYTAQSNEFQQQYQPAIYHLQPHSFSQPFQQPFTTQNALLSQSRQNRSTSTTLDSLHPHQEPSTSIPKKNKITAAEYYGRFNKYAAEENGERSSVDSDDSSSTTDINF